MALAVGIYGFRFGEQISRNFRKFWSEWKKNSLKFPTSEPCFEWQKPFIQAEKPVRCYSSIWQNSRLAPPIGHVQNFLLEQTPRGINELRKNEPSFCSFMDRPRM